MSITLKKSISVCFGLGILLLSIVLPAGCAEKENRIVAKDGNTVKIHYTGTLADGTVFDSSAGREPLEFTLGTGSVIPGFEEAVRGMQVGQEKTVTIPPEKAYGPHRDDMVLVMERDRLPEGLDPEVGQLLQMSDAGGRTMDVRVTDVSEKTITLDANAPLAGKSLTFKIELVEIK